MTIHKHNTVFNKTIKFLSALGVLMLAASQSSYLVAENEAPPSPEDPKIREKRPFLGDIKKRIEMELAAGKNADQIMTAVREEVRVDQAVICLKRVNGTIFQLHTRQDYNGVVTDPAQIALYTKFFDDEKVQQAINLANVSADAGTFKRPSHIISVPLKLDSNGVIQHFQANITVIDRDNICVARFSSPGENKVYSSDYPTTKTNVFGEAVAMKVDELMQGTITVNQLQRDVMKNVEIEEAVICVYKVSEGNYFRLHSRNGNDGFVGEKAEIDDYQRFFGEVTSLIKPENPRPDLFKPNQYMLANSSGAPQKFSMYPFVIDDKHICFGRILVEENGKPVATVTDTATTPPAA